ncbi:MAG: hypothetical protein ACT4N8_06820 [Sphingosinicella sp.]|uniref:hypothetical protein n=1 Tax=Sphingosinicella sp. TaxID=1917971 RepID=UPI004037A053
MQSSHIMVIMIVLIVMIASVFRAKYGGGRSRHGHGLPATRDDAETRHLRDEVKQLRERLQVLERITVEKENSLEREIEKLRDR